MQRLVLLSAAALSLAACQPQVPDSARGVGFESYSDYMARRDGRLSGQPMSNAAPIDNQAIMSGPIGSSTGAAPAANTGYAGAGAYGGGSYAGAANAGTAMPELAANRPRGDAPNTIQVQTGEMARHGSGISDEQNFDAVAKRETIASDAERRKAQQAQYVQIEPTALPQRAGDSGPNIVQFALSTSHNPGTKMYSRSSFRLKSYDASCAPFTSADQAQEAFLGKGGPQRDSLGVDPDGDGFACGWDPRPFRIR